MLHGVNDITFISNCQANIPFGYILPKLKKLLGKQTATGARIESVRKKLFPSQGKAAEKLNISQSQMSKYEAGKTSLSKQMADEMAKIFNVDSTWLLTGEPPAVTIDSSNTENAISDREEFALDESDFRECWNVYFEGMGPHHRAGLIERVLEQFPDFKAFTRSYLNSKHHKARNTN